MIVLRLKGGLGNQMFQYAFGRVLSIKNKTDLVFNIEAYEDSNKRPFRGNFAIRTYDLDVFNIKGRVAKKKEIPFLHRMYFKGGIMLLIDAVRRRIFRYKAHELYTQKFNSLHLNLGPNSYIDGFFQSPKYWQGYEDIIREDFTLRVTPNDNIQSLYKKIIEAESLCIHVRRGDFIGNKDHEIVSLDYYVRAMDFIDKRCKVDNIYVFSDDIDWCKDNMKFRHPTVFVGNDYAGQKGEGHIYLISGCKNFIIPNSTFSWWGAWLSANMDKTVIAPKIWSRDPNTDMSDLLLDGWISI